MKFILPPDYQERLLHAEARDWNYNKLCVLVFFMIASVIFFFRPFGVSSPLGGVFLTFGFQIVFLLAYDHFVIGTPYHPEFAFQGVVVEFMEKNGYRHARWNHFYADGKQWTALYPKRNPHTKEYELVVRAYDPVLDDCDP